MNEQAIIDSYNLAVQNGYKKSVDEFKTLLSTNSNALNDIYNLSVQNGYKKSIEDYKVLMGVSPIKASGQEPEMPAELKKKEDTTALPSGLGSSVSSVSAEATPEMAKFGYQPGKPLPQQIPSVQPEQPTKPKYTEEVMFGPMGISGVKTTGRAPEFIGKSIPKVVGEIGKVLTKGAVKFPAGVLETAAIATAAARNLAAKTGIVDETSALDISIPIGPANVNFYQAAGEWKNLVNDFVPTDKDIESGFWGQTANALGEMIPILLTGAISGGARAIAKEAGKKGLSMQGVANYGKNVVSRIGTPQGVLTISQVAAPSYEQAKLEGATENEALGYAIQNAVMTFPLEMLPVNNLFKRLDNALVGNKGVEVLKRAVIGGGEEFITEGVQAVYENITADAIYGSTRSFLDGVGEASAVGGTVGAIMNGVLTALLGRRARATSNKEIEEIDKSIKDVEQKIAQVDSNNESLRETVKVLEETKPRVLSYGSANYNFIESPKGDLEYADDALTEQQAQGIIGNLANSYKKIDFQIEEVEPDDPYQPTTYKIIGKPKTIKQDAIQEQAAGQVPVQSGTGVSQEVAQGEPQAEPQVTAEAGAQEEVNPIDKDKGLDNPDFVSYDGMFSKEKASSTSQTDILADEIGGARGYQFFYKGKKSRIEMMSPDEYLKRVREGFKTNKDEGILDLSKAKINEGIEKGDKIDMPSLSYSEGGRFNQEGRNRATVAKERGEKLIPVLIEEDASIDDRINKAKELLSRVKTKENTIESLIDEAQNKFNLHRDVVAFMQRNIDEINPAVSPAVSPVPTKEEVTPLQTTKQDTNEAIPTERVQPELRTVQPKTKATTKPAEPKGPARVSSKREQVKSSIQRIANAGLLRSAETGKQTITEQEIDAQMALTDAMARVWQETSGKDNFYETFFEDVKEGDIDAIRQKGGALFQSTELPQLPVTRVTLAVFELPEFQKMKGNMVAPQAVSDLMKSRGKQIEKDIINTVLSYDKYQGQKRISFDDFKDDVETQLMKLERIDTNTYASYGMDNLGDEQNYGTAQTIIFNSPIDHGQFGHFRGDFNNRAIQITTWNIRQVPNTEQYVAIDANMPAGVEQNEMAQYVGTAGPLADVQRWVNDRNSVSERNINVGLFGHIRNWFNRNTGVYTLAELQSDYFQKNKANDLYASKIPQEEIDEYMNKNFRSKLDKETRELFKKEFNIETKFVLDENGNKKAVGSFDSEGELLVLERIDGYTTPPIGYDVIENAENKIVIEAARLLARQAIPYSDVATRYSELRDEYEVKRKELKKEEYKYIAKRIDEVKKSEAGNLMLSQFVASQKVHELRLFRESLKHAADKGATELWFPTPYTIAVIEGYVSDKGTPPYEIIRGDDNYLEPGDLIDYGGTRMIVVESGGDYITVAARDSVSIYDIDDLRRDEVDNRMNELEYDLERQVSDINAITRQEAEEYEYEADEYMSDTIKDELNSYFENNPEEETVSWNKIIKFDVRDRVEKDYDYMTPQDLASWAEEIYEDGDTIYTIDERRATENLGQPSEYESNVNEDDFEDQLSETQSTIVSKYGELGEMIRKMRPDAEVVRDNNGKAWIKTEITAADASNPIIAFQEEGGKIKGAIDFSNDNKASVYVFDGADISTLTHEMSGHLGRRVLEKLAETNADFAKDYETAKKWAGVENNQWTRGAEEKWARGFEKYLRSGKAPSNALKNVFEKLKDWLTNIYKTIKGSSIDIKLTPSITSVFDNLLATKQEQGKEVDVLEDAFDFLDKIDKGISKTLKTRANDALLGIPLTAIQGMVKGLKALVQGGMKLRDAIKNIAAENNISQEKLRDILDIASIQEDFNTLMDKADKLIATQKSKEIPEKKIVSNLDKMVRDFYKDLDVNDAQRKIMEREARARMGVEPRKAASIGRVIGVLKDITNVTREEKLKIISRIRELGRDVTKDLASEIRELAASGKITATQAASIVARTLKINPLNEASVSNFVDYMAKVFSKADYVGKMGTALSQIKQAKKNIKTKIGISQDLFEPLNQLLSINPTLIPLNQLEKYLGILEDFSARKVVLSIPDRVKALKQVNEILEEVSNEFSLVDELADRFNNYEGKVFNEDGNLSYASTIKDMIDGGIITTDEADLMKKYKSEILPQVEPTPATDAEIEADKKKEIKTLKELKIDNKEFPLPSRDEKEDALNLAKLIKELSVEDLMNLPLTDLKNIIKVIGNINNGYLPHYAKVSIEKLEAIKQGKVLSGAIEKAKPLSFSKLYSRLKDKFTKKGAIDELIRANPLYYIDNVFGDFKTRDIFNSLLENSAQALSNFNSELKRVSQKIDAAQNKVLASFRQNPDKYLMSKFRMTAYMLQREYESNVGKKGVKPVADYLKATIKHIRKGKSVFKEADAEKLEKILKEVESYTIDEFYNTFNSAEKNAIKVMTEINASLGEKAAYTASVIRGNKVELMDNYFHHNVLHEQNPMDATAAPEFSNSYSNSMRPTTKAKSLIERTGALTPLNFDLFTSTQKGAKFVLLDYNMTSPIRTARRTLIQAEKNLESKGLMDKEKTQIFNAINNAYEEALENILTNNIVQDDLSNEVFDFIQKQGYRAALAGTTRFQAELASNIVNALLVNPKAFGTGIMNAKLIASANGYEFMKNAKSKQTSRLYASDALSGKLVDPQILKQTSGIKGSVSRGALRNRTTQIYNLTLKKLVQNPVEYIADTMLTTPDKVVSMPLWFGSFMNEFKRITGEEVNQEMMINNDLDYMQKNADAIEQATRKADQDSVYSGAANNEFMGVLKGKLKPNQGLTQKIWNNFNSFMTNFMNFDYAAARSAVYNLFNEGYMTKQKAAAVLAGITTRSVIYQVMVANMGAGIVGAALGLAFDWEDEEEVDEKSYYQMIGRGLANVFAGYTVGRNFGNAVRGMINFGVEKINEEYLDFLRNGEYDFYKDNIAYTYLNVGDRGDIDVPKIAINMAGAYTPALNTAVLIGKNFGALSSRVMGEGPTKKEPDAIRREDMTVNYRIPLEVAGNAGLIPFYKDVKRAVNDEIYKDLRKAANTPDSSITTPDDYDKLKDLKELKNKTRNQEERRAIDKKIVEIVGSEEAKAAIDKQKEMLAAKKKRLLYDSSKGQRYDNESDMKRLNPSLWRKRFGPNSDWNKETKAKEAVESKLQKEATAREDKEFKKKNRGN